MSELVCKDCNKSRTLAGHLCLNGRWIPGVVETNRRGEPVAENLDCLRPRSILESYYEDHSKALVDSELFNINPEFYNDDFFSTQLSYGNSHPTSSNPDLAPVGTSNSLMTCHSEQSQIEEWTRGSVNGQALNLDYLYRNDFDKEIRHGFPNCEMPSNIAGQIGMVGQLGVKQDNLCISSISNSSNSTPVFPTDSGTINSITFEIPSLYEFDVEPPTTIQNNDLNFFKKETEMSNIRNESPTINQSLIMRSKSLNDLKPDIRIDSNQWSEMHRLFSMYDLNSKTISKEDDLVSMSENVGVSEVERGLRLIDINTPTLESSLCSSSFNRERRLNTSDEAKAGHNVFIAPTKYKLGLNDMNFETHPEQSAINISLKQKSDSIWEGSSAEAHELPAVSELIEHNTHSQECIKRTQPIVSFKLHSGAHTRVEKFFCSVCHKDFREKSHLKTHMNIHEGRKKYLCNVCGKPFAHRGSLRRHLLIHTGERPFECEVCNKKFILKGNLNSHLLTHSGEKQFECEVCKKSFTLLQYLKKHAVVHTYDKPFGCEICGKKFGRKWSMKKHVETHNFPNARIRKLPKQNSQTQRRG